MKIITAFFVALSASTAFAESEIYETGAFRAIDVRDGVQVSVTIGDDYAVTATPVKGDLAQLRLKAFLPWLAIDRDTRWLIWPQWRDDVFAVDITTPVMNGVKALEGGVLTFTGDADRRLWAEAGDGGVVTLTDLEVSELTIMGQAGGRVIADGVCEELTIRGRDAFVDLRGLDCASIVVDAPGSDVLLPDGAWVVEEHPDRES
ncbi:GIN domain-containing protein [Yoonia sp. 2307UL14-13]|uniref:GIN domain-containing protein n=1 Tax=Yoonia sp. 2307UL14-13 TaxID=3126506 RepID=UPI00309F6F55